MKKQKTRKEVKVSLGFIIFFITIMSIIIYLFIWTQVLETQLSECQEQVYCGDTFRNSMSDSCLIGCIYSTKFYYDNPNVDFKEASYDCMLNCIEKAQDIQNKFSFCGVLP